MKTESPITIKPIRKTTSKTKPVIKKPLKKIDPIIEKTNQEFFGIWTDQEAKAFAKRIGRKLWVKKHVLWLTPIL